MVLPTSAYVITSPLSLARVLWWYGEDALWPAALGLPPVAVAELAPRFAELRAAPGVVELLWPGAALRDAYLVIGTLERLEGRPRGGARRHRRGGPLPSPLDRSEEDRWRDPRPRGGVPARSGANRSTVGWAAAVATTAARRTVCIREMTSIAASVQGGICPSGCSRMDRCGSSRGTWPSSRHNHAGCSSSEWGSAWGRQHEVRRSRVGPFKCRGQPVGQHPAIKRSHGDALCSRVGGCCCRPSSEPLHRRPPTPATPHRRKRAESQVAPLSAEAKTPPTTKKVLALALSGTVTSPKVLATNPAHSCLRLGW